MLIMSGSQLIAGLPLTVVRAVPAIFTLDSSGVGPGGILNQVFTVNSAFNPASRGSIVAVHTTGAGMMNPAPIDGQVTGDSRPLASLSVSVKISGTTAQVLYAGAAPGLVAGALQVNCVIPQNVTPGPSVPVELTVGTVSSPAGITMAVR